jgi:sugar lactone lactonase YvrE
MYILISHGANGHGAYSSAGNTINAGSTNADELTNCHCGSNGWAGTYTPTYVQKVPMQDPSNGLNSFDDIVTFKEAWQMQAQNFPLAATCQLLYVADCGGNRVEEFNSKGIYVGQIGGCSSGACSSGSGAGQFNCPTGVTIDGSGNIWVADSGNIRLMKFNSGGTYVSTFTDAHLNSPPQGAAFDAAGNFWIAQNTGGHGNDGLKYTAAGSYITGISGTGGGPPNLFEASSVATDASNNVYFAGYNSGNVQKYNSSGSFTASVALDPEGLLVDPTGNVWTMAACNVVYGMNSSLVLSGTRFGSFTCATGIALDSSGNFWVVDSYGNKVYEFDSSGTQLLSFGSSGSGNGQFNNNWANAGIAIGSR